MRRAALKLALVAAAVAGGILLLSPAGNPPVPAREGQPGSGKVVKSDAEWRAELAPEQYRVTRKRDTERPFTTKVTRPAPALRGRHVRSAEESPGGSPTASCDTAAG